MKALTNFFLNEWYFAIPMTLMMFIAFVLVIWRSLLNQGANSNLDLLLPDLQTNLKKKGTKAALALCETEKGLIPSQLYTAGLQAADQGVAAMRRSMASAVELEILPRLTLIAGFEVGTGFYINPTPPEEAAKYLREIPV